MTVEQLAAAVLDACEAAGVEHMLTGAFATSLYGVPRSTSDVDVVVDAAAGEPIQRVVATLAVQGIENFDLAAIRAWCVSHGTTDRLDAVLAALPAE